MLPYGGNVPVFFIFTTRNDDTEEATNSAGMATVSAHEHAVSDGDTRGGHVGSDRRAISLPVPVRRTYPEPELQS